MRLASLSCTARKARRRAVPLPGEVSVLRVRLHQTHLALDLRVEDLQHDRRGDDEAEEHAEPQPDQHKQRIHQFVLVPPRRYDQVISTALPMPK